MRSWILVGMMGSGKSSIGRSIAELSEREFIDTDHRLARRIGRSVKQIFSVYGETSFRDLEHMLLTELNPGATVVSTGGGIVLRDDNWEELQRLGPTLYLHASPETLIARLTVSKNKRPLLDVENWEDRLRELQLKRRPLYERADFRLDVDEFSVQEAAQRAYRIFAEAI